jgi:hypothetical protein
MFVIGLTSVASIPSVSDSLQNFSASAIVVMLEGNAL